MKRIYIRACICMTKTSRCTPETDTTLQTDNTSTKINKRDREHTHSRAHAICLICFVFGGRNAVSSITCVRNIFLSSSLACGGFSEVYRVSSLE